LAKVTDCLLFDAFGDLALPLLMPLAKLTLPLAT
jgi:hypothetical protein